eukprot:scaffold29919_cov70-Cyclotella_meneghiniana.AAC.6
MKQGVWQHKEGNATMQVQKSERQMDLRHPIHFHLSASCESLCVVRCTSDTTGSSFVAVFVPSSFWILPFRNSNCIAHNS